VSSLLAFLGVSLVLIMTPGPDTALVIRNTLGGGRTGGFATALGVAVGLTIWAAATSLGVAALLQTSAPLFLAIKYAGAAYLVVLGAQALRAAIFAKDHGAPTALNAAPTPARVAFRQGLISNLSNPKIAVFFPSLLPQFAPANGAGFVGLLSLGLLFAALTLMWLSFSTMILGRAGDMLRRAKVRRTLEGLTGGALIALGLRLAAEPN
jgi:threonine/homoserine/homoserine lactone efflux protein